MYNFSEIMDQQVRDQPAIPTVSENSFQMEIFTYQ